MIKVENIEVFNFEGALRGMRMPFMSHSKSDSCECDELQCLKCVYGQDEEDDCVAPDGFDYKYSIGKADMELCKKLIKGGSPHRKFLRQIFISMDITAPRFWHIELDTYKVGVTSNSCSTMHTIHKKPFTIEDFSLDRVEILNGKVEQKIVPITVSDEEWREIKSIPNVLISNTGRVKTKPYVMKLQDGRVRKYQEKELSILNDTSNGYRNVSIRMYGKRYHCKLHRLMAEAFLPPIEGKSCINHKDGNKLNNNLSNLEWVSYSENRQHAIDNGLVFWNDESRATIGNISRILNDIEICEILRMRIEGKTLDEISNIKKVPLTSVSKVCSGKYFSRTKTPLDVINDTIDELNMLRELYLKTNNKAYWRMIIEMLPQSYNQTRTVTMSYENALNIIKWRSNHKLDEWRTFCDILINELPYMKEFIGNGVI